LPRRSLYEAYGEAGTNPICRCSFCLQWADTSPIFLPVEKTRTDEFLECLLWLRKKEERL
jgi:hypothetical protein